jgi:hypothetical protein
MKTKTLVVLATGGIGLVFAGAALAVAGDEGTRPVAAAATLSPSTSSPEATAPVPDPTATADPSATTDPTVPGSPAATNPGTASTDAFGAEQARELALRTAGGGQVTEIEREHEHGRPVWSVEILNGTVEHEIDIDRESGKVNDHEREAADDDRDDDDHDDRDDDYDDED